MGFTFFHELFHRAVVKSEADLSVMGGVRYFTLGDPDPGDPEPGETEGAVNKIRRELRLPTREQYYSKDGCVLYSTGLVCYDVELVKGQHESR